MAEDGGIRHVPCPGSRHGRSVEGDAPPALSRFPNLIQDLRRQRRLVLRQETAVVVLHHIRGVLDRVACLLVGPGLLQDMGRQHVADVVWPMRQQPRNRAPPGERIVDAVALDRQPPGFIERGLVVGRIRARSLDRLHEERARILSLKTVKARLKAWTAWNGALPPRGQWHVIATEIGVTAEAFYREIARERRAADRIDNH